MATEGTENLSSAKVTEKIHRHLQLLAILATVWCVALIAVLVYDYMIATSNREQIDHIALPILVLCQPILIAFGFYRHRKLRAAKLRALAPELDLHLDENPGDEIREACCRPFRILTGHGPHLIAWTMTGERYGRRVRCFEQVVAASRYGSEHFVCAAVGVPDDWPRLALRRVSKIGMWLTGARSEGDFRKFSRRWSVFCDDDRFMLRALDTAVKKDLAYEREIGLIVIEDGWLSAATMLHKAGIGGRPDAEKLVAPLHRAERLAALIASNLEQTSADANSA